jgi:hypothetical protein
LEFPHGLLSFSLLGFAGSIVLAIVATNIHQHEGWFWAAAAFCVVVAIGLLIEPTVSPRLLGYWGRGSKVASQPSAAAVVNPGLDKTRDNQPTCGSKPDIWLSAAMWRAFLRTDYIPEGGVSSLEITEPEKQRFSMLIIDEFRQLAFDGKLPIWGRGKDHFILETVPRDFWRRNQIDHVAVARVDHPEEVKACAVRPWEKPDTSADWRHFKTSKAVIEKLYPRSQ